MPRIYSGNLGANKMKKAQAVREFLMDYGWHIIAFMFCIGIIASFGVFSGDKTLSYKECLAKEMCKGYGIDYYNHNSLLDKIECKELTSKGDYLLFEFIVDYDNLKERYPICAEEGK